ncbi:MAG TPA: acyltransferase family protein [Gaiellaceae bacterium]|nr:acyltransferase family protein [Gaiellaceae bacterium]
MPKPAKGPHLTYRPGLDGLRALAVGGVFLYHAWPHADGGPWLPGGFFGVDLFFVLSGYLITSLLLVEWEHQGRIVLLRFWARRARRLLPALIVVVLAALLLAAIFARSDLARTRSDAVSSLLYYTNWHLIIANHSYFTLMSRPSLLQHFWSLAVEEQFYVIWPLLLVPGLVLLGRRYLPFAVAAGIAGSAALMWLLYNGPDSDPSRVYYGTDTRAFLLLMGIELALLWRYVERIKRSLPLLELAGLAALGMTIWLFFTIQSYDPTVYQGGDLAAAFCFAVLIAAVAHPATQIGRALGIAPLRWIGERSYGIYLWHWPIIAITRPGLDVGWTGPGLIAAQAALTVLAAALSFRFVEQPIRTGRLQKRLAGIQARRRFELLGAGTAALVAAFAVLFVTPSPENALATTGPGTTHHPTSHHHKHSTHPSQHHQKKKPRKKKTLPQGRILAMGDSVMLGCSSELQTALDNRVRVDASVGRQIDATITELDRLRAKWGLPKTIVLQIGNNGPLYYADLVRLRHALRGVPDVVVVNVRNSTPWEGESNHAIDTWVQGWRQAHIADWYGRSTDAMLSDGTHPWPRGCVIYAHVIAATLRAS